MAKRKATRKSSTRAPRKAAVVKRNDERSRIIVKPPLVPLHTPGVTGVKRSGQYVYDEWHPKLRGKRGLKIFREMSDNDAVIGSVGFGMRSHIQQADINFEPAEKSNLGEGIAAHVEECFHDMSMTPAEFVSDVLSMMWAGHSLHGIYYKIRRGPSAPIPELRSKYNDGKVGWRKLPIRAQDTIDGWDFAEDGDIEGAWQMAPPKYKRVHLPIFQHLLFRTVSNKNNPEGRALAVDTPIPTPDGWTEIGNLQEGDKVYDETGKIRYVTWTSEVWKDRPTYQIEFSSGETVIADANHQWVVTTSNDRHNDRETRTLTTEELLPLYEKSHLCCGVAPVLDGQRMQLPVDPYVLGYWLGDGSLGTGQFAVSAADYPSLAEQIRQAGFAVRHDGDRTAGTKGLKVALRTLGVLHHKHIPAAYLRASPEQRLALLRGLMDSDGTSATGKDQASKFYNSSPELIDAIVELIRTLGGKPRKRVHQEPGRWGGTVNGRTVIGTKRLWEVSFYLPFRVHELPRKAEKQSAKGSARVCGHFIKSITRVRERDTVCIQVDSPSHLFLAGECMVPTHNSLYRNAYRSWFFLKRIQELEAIGVERDMAGMLVFELPAEYFDENASDDEKQTIENYQLIAERLRRGEHAALMFPSEDDADGKTGWRARLMQSGGRRPMDTDTIIKRLESRIAITVLGEAVLLGMQGNVGSWSLASSKTHMFAIAVRAVMRSIEDVVSRFAIPRLVELNRWPVELSPSFAFGDVESDDLGELMTALAAGVGVGLLTPGPGIEQYLRVRAGLPLEEDVSEMQLEDALGQVAELDAQGPAALQAMGADAAAQAVVPIEAQADAISETLSSDDAAEVLGVPRRIVNNAVRRGQLAGMKIGNKFRIHRRSLVHAMRGKLAA